MVSRRLKLQPNLATERELGRVSWQLAGLYNWAVVKLFRDASEGVFYGEYELMALVNGHGKKCGLNQQTMREVVRRAHRAHGKRKKRNRPAKLKSKRNRMGSAPVARGIRWIDRTHLHLPGFGAVKVRPGSRFPVGKIKYGLVQKRPCGWYVTLVVDGPVNPVPPPPADAVHVGVDFGFKTLATLSTGEKVAHPGEYAAIESRLGQADRGKNRRLLGRLHQRLANSRRMRNHAISRDLLTRHAALYLSRDNYHSLSRCGFGKSVHSAGIYQLITMLHSKSRPGGCAVIEVTNRYSTKLCSACGALTGPSGVHSLKVRSWACACGATHDRDVNAAVNTLKFGAVLAHEMAGDRQSETSTVGGSQGGPGPTAELGQILKVPPTTG